MLDIVTGTQFGDEGKGRIVHNLSMQSKYVAGVRTQGANNAGHTIVHNQETFKLHLLSSTVVSAKPALIGRCVAVNLDVLMNEIEGLKQKGLNPKVMVDPQAHTIWPWHILRDELQDERQGKFSAKSTKRGVAPVYSDLTGRNGLRVADVLVGGDKVQKTIEYNLDLVFNGELKQRLENATNVQEVLVQVKKERQQLKEKWEEDFKRVRNRLENYKEMVSSVRNQVISYFHNGSHVLGENAQASMLSVYSPYYPYTTSSDPNATGTWQGLGIAPKKEWMGKVIGVGKAYVTRVGGGPFVTEIFSETADYLVNEGGEFGTTTGRRRKVGWFDVPMVKDAEKANSLTHFAFTKIDVLGGLKEVKICTHYIDQNGQILHDIPVVYYDKVKPVYESFQGWPKFTEDEYRKQLENGVENVSNSNLREFLLAIQRYFRKIDVITFGQSSEAFIDYTVYKAQINPPKAL